ncbi:MAG: rhodanese-like domain-containing protein, partial [Anaerolineaceae bacterium]
SPADAKGILGQGNAVFVDVRSPESYAEAHIPGSVNIPIDVFETRWKEMDPDRIIILYCT